ncbi:MAG TPA: sugar phosphate isomerase/epimerase family protein [Chloroflexota bacterium]|jgi:sugar phosphate isomerase/epimerase|nr:sugar phosphate isomerase/epimerase family protein [Chloroflexota bacterium]
MKITLSTGSVWTYGLNRAFEMAARSGFDAVEVIVDERWDTRQSAYLERLMNSTGIEVTSLHSPFSALRDSGGYRACILETMALADRIGATTVVVHPESQGKGYGTWLRQHWDELHAGRRAVLAVENMPYRIVKTQPRHRTHRPEQLLKFERATFDTAHFGLASIDIMDALEIVRPRLHHIHLSDQKKKKEHLCLGDGVLPIVPFVQRLQAIDFQGIVVLELSPEGLPVENEDQTVERLRQARALCLDALRPAREPALAGR